MLISLVVTLWGFRMTDFDLDSNGDLSKSEMFELSGHLDTDSSQMENTLGFSNLDLDVS